MTLKTRILKRALTYIKEHPNSVHWLISLYEWRKKGAKKNPAVKTTINFNWKTRKLIKYSGKIIVIFQSILLLLLGYCKFSKPEHSDTFDLTCEIQNRVSQLNWKAVQPVQHCHRLDKFKNKQRLNFLKFRQEMSF